MRIKKILLKGQLRILLAAGLRIGNHERNQPGLKDWTFVQLLFSNNTFSCPNNFIKKKNGVNLGKRNSVKSHWIFASCASYTLIQSILYIDHAPLVDIHRNVRRMHRNCRIMVIDCPFAAAIRVFTFFSGHASMLWSNVAVMFAKISMDRSVASMHSIVEAPLHCIYVLYYSLLFPWRYISARIPFELTQW